MGFSFIPYERLPQAIGLIQLQSQVFKQIFVNIGGAFREVIAEHSKDSLFARQANIEVIVAFDRGSNTGKRLAAVSACLTGQVHSAIRSKLCFLPVRTLHAAKWQMPPL